MGGVVTDSVSKSVRQIEKTNMHSGLRERPFDHDIAAGAVRGIAEEPRDQRELAVVVDSQCVDIVVIPVAAVMPRDDGAARSIRHDAGIRLPVGHSTDRGAPLHPRGIDGLSVRE